MTAAMAHLRSLQRQGVTGRVIYRCKFCGRLHIGRPKRNHNRR